MYLERLDTGDEDAVKQRKDAFTSKRLQTFEWTGI